MKSEMVRCRIDLKNPPPLTQEQKARLDALEEKPDSAVDFDDIPRLTEEWFAHAAPNPYLRRPVETTIKLDERLLSWLRGSGDGSPESIDAQVNEILRKAMLEHETPVCGI